MKETGLPVPSVCGAMHWKYLLSDPDPQVREKGVEALKFQLRMLKHSVQIQFCLFQAG
jgi:L-ribulose-5-phosphate 3-epimerase UlaE